MKKIIAILLITVMCVTLAACNTAGDKTDNTTDNGSSEPTDTENTTATTESTTPAKPKDKTITWEEFQSAVTIIDLTMDNWEEYFEIVEIEEITPADFEDEEPDIKRDIYVKLKAENMYAADTTIRFTYSQAQTNNRYDATTKALTSSNSDASYRNSEDTLTQKSISYQDYLGTIGSIGTSTYNRYQYNGVIYESVLDVKDIECVKVEGKILILNLPEDAWDNKTYGEDKFYIRYEKDGKKNTVMKDFMAQTLRNLFVLEQ